MTLEEAHELRAGDVVSDELRATTLLVLDQVYSDFEAFSPGAQWRLPVLNLERGKQEYWPNARFEELSRV